MFLCQTEAYEPYSNLLLAKHYLSGQIFSSSGGCYGSVCLSFFSKVQRGSADRLYIAWKCKPIISCLIQQISRTEWVPRLSVKMLATPVQQEEVFAGQAGSSEERRVSCL